MTEFLNVGGTRQSGGGIRTSAAEKLLVLRGRLHSKCTVNPFQNPMKIFQVLSAGKPVFFFEVKPEYADDEPSERNVELAENLANALGVKEHGPKFMPQLLSRLPLVVEDRAPDHSQPGLKAWVSPKLKR